MEQTYLLAPEQLQFEQQRQALDRKGLTLYYIPAGGLKAQVNHAPLVCTYLQATN